MARAEIARPILQYNIDHRGHLITAKVQELLAVFEALTPEDKHDAAVEIFHRYTPLTGEDLPETLFINRAAELFNALDAEEINQ
jgi:hypothetical protein